MSRRKLNLAGFVVVFLIGCGGENASKQTQSVVEERGAKRSFSEHYGGSPIRPVLTMEEKDWLERVTAKVSIGCVFDARLFEAAKHYAEVLATSSVAQRNGDMDGLRFAVLKFGTADYVLRPIVADTNETGLSSLVTLISDSRYRATHCGFGIAGNRLERRVVWIGTERHVNLAPFPSKVETGIRVGLHGQVIPPRRTFIEPYFGHPNQSITRLDKVRTDGEGRFAIEFEFAMPGRSQIELLIDRGRGSETAVLVPVFVGRDPDPGPVVVVSNDGGNGFASPEAALVGYLAAARKRAGLPPLKVHRKLSGVARSHSLDMAARGFFGHRCPDGYSLDKRLRRAGLFPVHAAENVAKSSSALRIHRNLMESPSHRINVLDPKFTHVGVGIVPDKNELVATEVFARLK